MSFLAPVWLAIAGAAAVGVVIAHLFSTNTPPKQLLPTVRFVPQGAPMAVLRTRRLTDIVLLLLRMLAVALLGLALAGAHFPVQGPRRVVLVDASRAVGTAHTDSTDETDAADRVIVFDSVARAVDASVLDTLRRSGSRGSLSAGVVAAHRAIAEVTTGRDEIDLVIISPLVREEVDSTTSRLLALWEGPVRLVRTAAASPLPAAPSEVRAEGDDPVAAAAVTLPRITGEAGARIVRTAVTDKDSAWARQGGVLVLWPLSAASDTSATSAWAVATNTHTVVGVAKPARAPSPGRPVAWWANGEPAATETPLGAGCVRDVAIGVDRVGDIALRESFRGLVRALLEPCGGARDFTAVPDSAILPRARASAASVAGVTTSRLPLVLALAALAMLALEQWLRRRRRTA